MTPQATLPDDLPWSPACDRNKGPILDHLRTAFARVHRVLEIGSGTGQHAVHFASALHYLEWQPTDLEANLPALRARLDREAPGNVRPPLALDVHARPWSVAACDGVYSANTLHIVDWDGVVAFFGGAAEVLESGGTLCVYGPFRYAGAHTSASNAAFDAELRLRDPASGVRDFERVAELAATLGLGIVVDHALPANNRLLTFRKVG